MPTWEVTIPIAGHALMTVEADTEKEAIELGMMEASLSMVEIWEPLEQFGQGNVNYCPRPWSAEAVNISDDEPNNET